MLSCPQQPKEEKMVQKKAPETFRGYIDEHSMIVGYPCRKGNEDLPSVIIPRKKGHTLEPRDIINALKGKNLPKRYGKDLPKRYGKAVNPTQVSNKERD